MEDFINNLAAAIIKLLRYHYVSQKQSSFFNECKELLLVNEGILIGDFSENYSFLVQDALQGFHWDNSQCTLHPFVFYYQSEKDGVLGHKSICFVSQCLRHTTAMVYTFLQDLIPHIKINYPQVKKVIYFSDGCAGQYKNRYNFINLLHHEEDFELQAEWNFFATSHGKNACDGIGGTLKRSAAKTSLQHPLENQILIPLDFFNYCNKNMKHITMFYTPTKKVEN